MRLGSTSPSSSSSATSSPSTPSSRRPKGPRASPSRAGAGAAAAAATALGAWSLFEAQWVEWRELDVAIEGLPHELDGFRILHLSDLHLGTLSFNSRAVERALERAEERGPDLVAITGDLVSRRGGKGKLEEALSRLRPPYGVYAVLGNHDVDHARDPFSRPTDLADLHGVGAVLLRDAARTIDVRGRRLQVVGVDPNAYRCGRSRPAERAARDAAVRILLCHYPTIVRRLPPNVFHLILAGHLHGGQICLPSPWGKIRLKDMRATHSDGLFATRAGLLHVSRGLGTTFVPFRLLARPETTLLTLRRSD